MRRRWQCVTSLLVVVVVAALTGCNVATSRPSRVAGSTPTGPISTAPTDDHCPDVEILGLRGQGQSASEAAGVGPEVSGVATVVEAGLAERGLRARLVAVRHPARSGSDADYTADLRQGVRMTTAKIAAVARRCPETRVVLIGFSMGAQVVHLTAADLAPRWRSHIAGVALLGDPLRDPAAQVVQLTLGSGTADGAGSNGPGAGFGKLSGRVVSVCVADDNVCNVGPSGRVGGVSQAHRQSYETPRAAMVIGTALAQVLH